MIFIGPRFYGALFFVFCVMGVSNAAGRHNFDHLWIHAYLLGIFLNRESDLLLEAAADATMRWNLRFVLRYWDDCVDKPFGGTVNYNKKERRFDFIEYCDSRGWAVRISIRSGCYWSAREHRDYLYRNVPEFYHHDNKLAEWLMTH